MADEAWRVPTPVQELAAGRVEEPPSRYVQREQDRPGSLLLAVDMPEPLPVVDISRLPAADETSKLFSALETWGLFIATNHGIDVSLMAIAMVLPNNCGPSIFSDLTDIIIYYLLGDRFEEEVRGVPEHCPSLMDDVMNASGEFFRQPLEEKLKCSNLIEGKRFRLEGYGDDFVRSKDQILDWNDRLHLQVEPEDERTLAYWPKHPESFRDVLHEYASETKRIRDAVLGAMARIFELDEDYFISRMGDRAPAHARFNYYPPCPRPELVLGIKPHSDPGALTVLLVDKDVVSGLQVLRDGVWYSVPSFRHSLLINLGDSMEIMNNGIFKSPVHRVVTNAEKERMSLAIFYAVDGEKMLEPAAGLVDETRRPARYRRIKVKDYVAALQENFSKGVRMVETLKI